MRKKLLVTVLIVVSAYHILLGGLTWMSEEFAVSIVKNLFGMHLEPTDQLSYIAKVFGIYSAVFGCFAALAAKDPFKYRHVIHIAIGLYVLRFLNRLIFSDLVSRAFQVSTRSMWVEIVLLAFFAVILFVLRPKAHVETNSRTA